MTPAQVLRDAAALINFPARFARCSFARATNGMEVDPNHPWAKRWSVYGAVLHVAPTSDAGYNAVFALAEHLGVGSVNGVIRWSNQPGLTHTQAVDALTAAARAWEAGPRLPMILAVGDQATAVAEVAA